MKYGCSKMLSALALALILFPANASARQAAAGQVTGEEEAAARATAAAFAERLGATHDFAAVARELYADDFMPRQLKRLTGRPGRGRESNFMLEGVPSLTFEHALAAGADAEDWKRLRLAADNLLHFMFLSQLAGRRLEELGDPDKFDERSMLAVFPPEAVKVLGANPAASNFLLKSEREVIIRTPGELRALAAALAEAVRLTRPRFVEALAKGKHFDENMRLLAGGFSREGVRLAEGEAEAAGYPAGTRLFRVYAPNAYSLLLVGRGGELKVVWAGWPSN